MIERYLQGRLTAEEERAFEERYLADPALLDELELEDELGRGLKELHARGELPGGHARPEAAARAPWLRILGSPRYAAAATVLLGLSWLLSAGLYYQNRSLRADGAGAPAAGTPTRLVPLVAVRGPGGATAVTAPAPREWTVLLVDAGFTEYQEYRAVVARDGAPSPILELEGLAATYDGTVPIGLPGALLTPGRYEIVLEGRRGAAAFEPVSRTPFTIAPAR
ncbi:MAG TPA: hypothetical protein VF322_11605 [Gammaproteobacteria bacterium]